MAALTLANGCRASRLNLGVSRVIPHPAASRAQIRAPICLLTRGIAVRVAVPNPELAGLLYGSQNGAADQAGYGDVPCFGGFADAALLLRVNACCKHYLTLALFRSGPCGLAVVVSGVCGHAHRLADPHGGCSAPRRKKPRVSLGGLSAGVASWHSDIESARMSETQRAVGGDARGQEPSAAHQRAPGPVLNSARPVSDPGHGQNTMVGARLSRS
jgi:hypothetical protein